jgi:hypothetical protein
VWRQADEKAHERRRRMEGGQRQADARLADRSQKWLVDDFWAWRNQRDIDRWRKRQHDGVTSRFRGRPCWQLHEPQTNSQSVSSN